MFQESFYAYIEYKRPTSHVPNHYLKLKTPVTYFLFPTTPTLSSSFRYLNSPKTIIFVLQPLAT